jgi:hypothetical protein
MPPSTWPAHSIPAHALRDGAVAESGAASVIALREYLQLDNAVPMASGCATTAVRRSSRGMRCSAAQHSTAQHTAIGVCHLPFAPRAAAASPAGAAVPVGICETPVCRLCRHYLYPASIHENSMKPSFALRPNSHNSLQPCHWPIDVRYLSPVSQGYRTPARYRRQNAPLAASDDADHPPESLSRCELYTPQAH